jgi:hypothetical protein
MLISFGGCAFEAQIYLFIVKSLFDWSITKKSFETFKTPLL